MASGPSKLFEIALEECITEFRTEPERKDKFFHYYMELLSQFKNTPTTATIDSADQSRAYSERFHTYIRELDLNHKNKSRARRISDRLYPFVTGASQYLQACDVMVQAGPSCVQLVWGGARIILQMASNAGRCFEQVVDILEKAGRLMTGYHIYAEAFADSLDMQHILIQSYSTIIHFWYKAAKLLSSRNIVLKVARDLGKEWQMVGDKLDEDRRTTEFYARGVEARRVRAIGNEERAFSGKEDMRKLVTEHIEVRTKSRKEIIAWIRGHQEDELGVDRKIEDNLAKRQDSTCEWLFQRPEIQRWSEHKSKKQCAIWYNAGPGTGKTMLCSSIAEKLRNTSHENGILQTSNFFFSFNDPRRNKAFTAIRSLALQLFNLLDVVPDAVRTIYERDLEKEFTTRITNITTACEVLDALLGSLPRIHIIIDGLDECDNYVEFLRILTPLIAKERMGIVKWFLASRAAPGIRDIMSRHDIIEIREQRDDLESDILSYLQGQLHCTECERVWAKKAHGNFLWVSLMLPVIKGETSTCGQGLEEELERLPVGLTGCYARSLTFLGNLTEEKQRTAQAMLAIVVTALQPLRLSELRHALAAHVRQPEDYNDYSLPKIEAIKELFVDILVLEDGEDTRDPLVKVLHKSVQDFLLQDPGTLKLPNPSIKRFFVDERAARIALGQTALTYMMAKRYRRPGDVAALLWSEDHAFLKHAATFWHRYLSDSTTSSDIVLNVMKFVKSEQFWTCVAVQSRVAPHLFARFDRKGSGYSIGTAGPTLSRDPDSVIYAFPLPSCLEDRDHGLEGAQISERFHQFVCEWHTVLNSYPEALKMTAMDEEWDKLFKGKSSIQWKRLRARNVVGGSQKATTACMPLGINAIKIKSGITHVSVTEYETQHGRYNQRWRTLDVPDGSISSSFHSSSMMVMAFAHAPRFQIETSNNKSLLVDIEELSVHTVGRDGANLKTAKPLERQDGLWHVHCTGMEESGGDDALATFHCVRTFPTKTSGSCRCMDPTSNLDSDFGSNSSNDSDSGDEGYVGSDSTSNADDDTASSVSTRSSLRSTNSKHDQDTRHHCILVVSTTAEPRWHFWVTLSTTMVEVPCAVHPTSPTVVWSAKSHEISVLNSLDGKLSTCLLPEPLEVNAEHVCATRREFHFSPQGDLLQYLLYIAEEINGGIKHTIALSTFFFTTTDDGSCELERTHRTQYVSHEAGTFLHHPLILTCWDDSCLYIALPPLGCNAKILRFNLPQSPGSTVESDILTLIKPVFFPNSAASRNPRIRVLAKSSKSKKKVLALLLDAERAPCAGNEQCNDHKISKPPAVLTWELDGDESWRTWDPKIDGQDQRVKNNERTYEMLRGSFVMADREFNVTARSGLDWKRVAYLSCA